MIPVEDMYAAELAATEAATETWDAERTLTALYRVDRNDGPALIVDLMWRGMLQDGVLTAVVGEIWSAAEYPDRSLDHATWRNLFEEAGYTVDGKPDRRPKSPLRLYRGSVESRRTDWSWTDNLAIAERYAAGKIGGRPTGLVWTALVEPTRLLACNRVSRGEDEFIVDTDELLIQPLHESRNRLPE